MQHIGSIFLSGVSLVHILLILASFVHILLISSDIVSQQGWLTKQKKNMDIIVENGLHLSNVLEGHINIEDSAFRRKINFNAIAFINLTNNEAQG